MSRAVLIALIAMFTLSLAPVSPAHADDDGDIVVWGN